MATFPWTSEGTSFEELAGAGMRLACYSRLSCGHFAATPLASALGSLQRLSLAWDAPTTDKPKSRELSMEELDSIVGGGAPTAIHSPFTTMITMDSSHGHFKAAAPECRQHGADWALDRRANNSCGRRDTTVDQFNVAQTHVSDPFVHVSSNPAQAIYAYEANFISDIQKEVSAHKITGDQAVTQLAGFAHEFPNQQSVVANEIAALINNHQVTAVHAASDIGAAVTSHAMNADDAIGLLANLGAHPGPGIQSNAAGEIAWLVGQPYAAHVLIGMSAHGNAVVQADVHNAISVTSSRLTSAVRLTRPD